MKKNIISVIYVMIFACIVLCSASVFAASAQHFSVASTPVVTSIYSDQFATIEFVIHNTYSQRLTFQIYTLDPRWILATEPHPVTISPGEKQKVIVYLDPTNSILQSGNYAVPVIVRAPHIDQSLQFSQDVQIRSDEYRDYLPSIFLDLEAGDRGNIDPSQDVPVKIRLINRNRLVHEQLFVHMQGSLFEDTDITTLGSKEDLSKTKYYRVDPLTAPGNYSITVSLRSGERNVNAPKTFWFNVVPTYPLFQRDSQIDEVFLKKTWNISFESVGNVAKTEDVKIAANLWQRLFTSSNVEHTTQSEDGQTYMVFSVALQPGEVTELYVVKNYRPFAIAFTIVIILSIIGLFLYLHYRSAVVVLRSFKVLSADDDATSKVKVMITVKNRTGKAVERVKIYEQLSHITEVEDSFEMGTLRPSRMLKSNKKGTLVCWDFVTLEPYEERIITYKLQSKLSILGDFSLPATTVQYEQGERKRKFSFSQVSQKK